MDLKEMRKRIEEIRADIARYNALEDLTSEDVKSVKALSDEFESLKEKIEAKEKLETMSAQVETSQRRVQPVNVVVGEDRITRDPRLGFRNSGEFFKAIHSHATSGQMDKRLQALGHQEKIGEDGGFLVPEDIRLDIQKKVQGDESLLPLTKQFNVTGNSLVLPVSEVAPWDGAGIQAYWTGEAAQMQESKTKFREVSFRLHKLTALARVTDELLEDSAALESHVRAEAPAAIVSKVNNAIIGGSGVGQPKGLIGSSFRYTVAKESGQAADTIKFANINNMYARLLPMSAGKANWFVNPAVLQQLPLMKFDEGATSPVPVYLPAGGLSSAPYGQLLGRPIKPMGGALRALGDEGDIILADLSYYYSIVKSSGIRSEISTHVYFDTNEVAFKFIFRMDGGVPFNAPVTTEYGAYQMSGIVTLQDR